MIGRHDRDGKAAALRVMAEEDVRGGATFAISGDDMGVRQYTRDVGGGNTPDAHHSPRVRTG
jgi:hypothetical protein